MKLRIKKQNRNAIILWSLILFTSFLIMSCNARKSEINKKEEAIKTDITINSNNSSNSSLDTKEDLNIKKALVSKIDQQTQSESDELTVEPIDNTKPSIYTDPSGRKHVLENAKMTNKKNKQNTKTNSSNSSNSEELQKAELKYKNEQQAKTAAKIKAEKELSEKNKKAENAGFSSWNYLLFLFPIGLIIVVWRVYKKLNPVV
jgi:thiol:disulfide interchange protein